MLALGGELQLGHAPVGAVAERRRPRTGPAGRSIATSRETSSFASFTGALPGPTIFATRWT